MPSQSDPAAAAIVAGAVSGAVEGAIAGGIEGAAWGWVFGAAQAVVSVAPIPLGPRISPLTFAAAAADKGGGGGIGNSIKRLVNYGLGYLRDKVFSKFKGVNVLVGGGFSAVFPTGIEGSGGFVLNPGWGESQADFGVFGSLGVGVGVNFSADIFAGFIKGDIENVSGITANLNVVAKLISITTFFDSNTGEWLGGTIGIGPSVTTVGGSVTGSITGTFTVRDIIDYINDLSYATNPSQ